MAQIPNSLRLLFEGSLEEEDGRYVISIPAELVENGSLSTEDMYRIALLSNHQGHSESDDETANRATTTADTEPEQTAETPVQSQNPPVSEGETRSVTIDTLGDQGDGIAKVERGFILIVPGTQPGDQAEVEITDVRDSVAFAEPISDPTVR